MTADTAGLGDIHDELTSDVLSALLDKLGEIARAASGGSFVFRGEPKWYLEISSSPLSRIQDIARTLWL